MAAQERDSPTSLPAKMIVIRPLQTGEMAALIRLCGEHAAYEQVEFRLDQQESRLAQALFHHPPRLWCFVAEADGEIVGYCTCSKEYSTWQAAEYLYMDCLYIVPNYRNSGTGSKMLRAVAQLACSLDCRVVEWQTPQWNVNAARFYERNGAQGKAKIRFSWQPECASSENECSALVGPSEPGN